MIIKTNLSFSDLYYFLKKKKYSYILIKLIYYSRLSNITLLATKFVIFHNRLKILRTELDFL